MSIAIAHLVRSQRGPFRRRVGQTWRTGRLGCLASSSLPWVPYKPWSMDAPEDRESRPTRIFCFCPRHHSPRRMCAHRDEPEPYLQCVKGGLTPGREQIWNFLKFDRCASSFQTYDVVVAAAVGARCYDLIFSCPFLISSTCILTCNLISFVCL